MPLLANGRRYGSYGKRAQYRRAKMGLPRPTKTGVGISNPAPIQPPTPTNTVTPLPQIINTGRPSRKIPAGKLPNVTQPYNTINNGKAKQDAYMKRERAMRKKTGGSGDYKLM